MKSNNVVTGIALLFLVFAVVSSITIWSDVSSPVKIGMFAFGFGSGVAAGILLARRTK
jgi:tellurite resistance protein TehA-like permease